MFVSDCQNSDYAKTIGDEILDGSAFLVTPFQSFTPTLREGTFSENISKLHSQNYIVKFILLHGYLWYSCFKNLSENTLFSCFCILRMYICEWK